MAIVKNLLQQVKDRGETYTCFAEGKTYRVKEDLKSWGFFWDGEGRCWIRESVSEFEKIRFTAFTESDGPWKGIKLKFERDITWDWLRDAIAKEEKK